MWVVTPTNNCTQEAWLPQHRKGFPSLELRLSVWQISLPLFIVTHIKSPFKLAGSKVQSENTMKTPSGSGSCDTLGSRPGPKTALAECQSPVFLCSLPQEIPNISVSSRLQLYSIPVHIFYYCCHGSHAWACQCCNKASFLRTHSPELGLPFPPSLGLPSSSLCPRPWTQWSCKISNANLANHDHKHLLSLPVQGSCHKSSENGLRNMQFSFLKERFQGRLGDLVG